MLLQTIHEPERWLSGRKQRFAKPSYGQKLYRGFESPPLRHFSITSGRFSFGFRRYFLAFQKLVCKHSANIGTVEPKTRYADILRGNLAFSVATATPLD
jgi:hypothetical protein